GGDAGADVEDPDARERAGRHDEALSPPSCSAKTSFIDDFCLRASRALSAVDVLCIQWWAMKWYFQLSALPCSSMVWLIDSLTTWAVVGGTNAICAASACTADASSSRGTIRLTRPRRHASWASILSPVRRNSLALRGPISHGSTSSSTPAPVIFSTGLENTASSEATMRSH